MANVKITDLTELTTLSASDLVEVVDDPAGTPASHKMTMLNLVKAAMGLTNSDEFEVRAVLHDETLGAAGRFDVSSIPATYDHLLIRALLRSDAAAKDSVHIFFNADTTVTNYRVEQHFSANSGTAGASASDAPLIGAIPAADATSGEFQIVEVQLFEYAGSKLKVALIQQGGRRGVTDTFIAQSFLSWESTAAINQITLQPDGYATDEFVAGSYLQIIGIKGSG